MQAHTAGALFQQRGRRRVRVKGRGPTASTGSMERCSPDCEPPPPHTAGCVFVCFLQVLAHSQEHKEKCDDLDHCASSKCLNDINV